MEYEVFVSETGDYVHVKLIGEIDHKSAGAYLKETQDKLRQNQLSTVLVDVRSAINSESMSSNYWFIHNYVRKSGLNNTVKIAILVSPNDFSHDMIATISQNAGYNMRLFREEEEAIDWLKSRD